MPVFAYHARTPTGRSERGIVDAESLRAAWQQLRARGVFPTALEPGDGVASVARVEPAELAATTDQLASLVAAGVPIADALDALGADARAPAMRHALTLVRARLREGASLADALTACPRVFPPLYRELVRAGEASGALGAVLHRLARDGRVAIERRARLRTALVYPLVMLTMTSLVLVFLLVWVVPEVTRLFTETGTPLPLATRVLVATATALRATWWLWAFVVVAAGTALQRWYATSDGRRVLDALVLRLPVAGRLVGLLATARVARTLATVLGHGMPLDQGLALAAGTAGNAHIADAITSARESVLQGDGLALALRARALFPPSLCQLVATGERSGALAEAFAHAADAHEVEAERGVDVAMSFVEPVLVLVMGAAVLVLVLAILVPILTLDPLGARG
jgi:general secretion pathway protein F